MLRRAESSCPPRKTNLPLSDLPRWLAALGVVVWFSVVLQPTTSTGSGKAAEATPGAVRGPEQVASFGHTTQSRGTWAGYSVTYAATGTQFSDVSGTWTQPAVSCPTASLAAFWAGMDGLQKGNNTVEQIGTDSDCIKKKKQIVANYYGWWQLYPGGYNGISQVNWPVHANDTMSADVSRSGSTFTLTLTDESAGWTYSVSAPAPSATANSSADWIVEAPSSKLADFGSVTFSSCSADGQPIASSSFHQFGINMAKGKKPTRASPGPLLGGNGFTVSWMHE
jgi:hypothetical protein